MSNIELFVFSNTYDLDFHTLVTPAPDQGQEIAENCYRFAMDVYKKEFAHHPRLTLSARTIEGRRYLCIWCYPEDLPQVSSRFFKVARCGGTPTYAAIVLVMDTSVPPPFLNDVLLAAILRHAYTKSAWFATEPPPPIPLSISLPEASACGEIPNFFFFKRRASSREECYLRFYSEILYYWHPKMDVTFIYREPKAFASMRQFCNQQLPQFYSEP